MTLGLDYLLVACSNNNPGHGWHRMTSSQEEFRTWVNAKINFENTFSLYSQGKRLVEDVQSIQTSSNNAPKVKKSHNTSDYEKKELGASLNNSLSESAFLKGCCSFMFIEELFADTFHVKSKSLVSSLQQDFPELPIHLEPSRNETFG